MSDDSYERHVADCVAACRCCRDCAPVPCAGTMAGGVCDEMCWCTAPDCSDPAGDDGYDSDYEDQP